MWRYYLSTNGATGALPKEGLPSHAEWTARFHMQATAVPHQISPDLSGGDVVRLPRSGGRPGVHYTKLIRKVHRRWDGMAFDGPLFRPGAAIARQQLGPRPVVLEYAGPIGSRYGYNRRQDVYLLWRWDDQRSEWIEVARAEGIRDEWVIAFRDLAAALLHEGRAPLTLLEESSRVVTHVLAALDDELEWASKTIKARSLGILYEQVAGRLAGCGDDPDLRGLRKGVASEIEACTKVARAGAR